MTSTGKPGHVTRSDRCKALWVCNHARLGTIMNLIKDRGWLSKHIGRASAGNRLNVKASGPSPQASCAKHWDCKPIGRHHEHQLGGSLVAAGKHHEHSFVGQRQASIMSTRRKAWGQNYNNVRFNKRIVARDHEHHEHQLGSVRNAEAERPSIMSISRAAFWRRPHHEHSPGSSLPLETRQASIMRTRWKAWVMETKCQHRVRQQENLGK